LLPILSILFLFIFFGSFVFFVTPFPRSYREPSPPCLVLILRHRCKFTLDQTRTDFPSYLPPDQDFLFLFPPPSFLKVTLRVRVSPFLLAVFSQTLSMALFFFLFFECPLSVLNLLGVFVFSPHISLSRARIRLFFRTVEGPLNVSVVLFSSPSKSVSRQLSFMQTTGFSSFDEPSTLTLFFVSRLRPENFLHLLAPLFWVLCSRRILPFQSFGRRFPNVDHNNFLWFFRNHFSSFHPLRSVERLSIGADLLRGPFFVSSLQNTLLLFREKL